MQDTALMLHTLLELGESMLADGADVRRVEQTLTRMGLAYGAVRMDVFVITSSIVLTMCFPDETSVTQTRRIEKSAVTDFRKLEAINAISRSYCEKPFPVQELADRTVRKGKKLDRGSRPGGRGGGLRSHSPLLHPPGPPRRAHQGLFEAKPVTTRTSV